MLVLGPWGVEFGIDPKLLPEHPRLNGHINKAEDFIGSSPTAQELVNPGLMDGGLTAEELMPHRVVEVLQDRNVALSFHGVENIGHLMFSGKEPKFGPLHICELNLHRIWV